MEDIIGVIFEHRGVIGVAAAIGAICIVSALVVMFGWSMFSRLLEGLDPHPSEGGR